MLRIAFCDRSLNRTYCLFIINKSSISCSSFGFAGLSDDSNGNDVNDVNDVNDGKNVICTLFIGLTSKECLITKKPSYLSFPSFFILSSNWKAPNRYCK